MRIYALHVGVPFMLLPDSSHCGHGLSLVEQLSLGTKYTRETKVRGDLNVHWKIKCSYPSQYGRKISPTRLGTAEF